MEKTTKYFVLGLLLTLIPGSIFALSSNKSRNEGLNNVVEETLTPTQTPFPTQSPEVKGQKEETPSPAPKTKTPIPTPTETPEPTPAPITSGDIQEFIERFAAQYSVDPNVLRHIAICESGFDPNAANGDYVGLYQFGPITWSENRILIGENPDPSLRFNAEESVQTAAFLLATKGRNFWPNCSP